MSLKRITELLDTTVTSDSQLYSVTHNRVAPVRIWNYLKRQVYEESQFGKRYNILVSTDDMQVCAVNVFQGLRPLCDQPTL